MIQQFKRIDESLCDVFELLAKNPSANVCIQCKNGMRLQ